MAQENADIPPYVQRLFKRGKGCGNLRAKALLNTLELATVLHKYAGLMGKKDLMVQGNANMKASKIALEAKQVMLNLRAQISYSNCKMFHRDAGLMVMKDLVVPRIRSGGKSSLKCNESRQFALFRRQDSDPDASEVPRRPGVHAVTGVLPKLRSLGTCPHAMSVWPGPRLDRPKWP